MCIAYFNEDLASTWVLLKGWERGLYSKRPFHQGFLLLICLEFRYLHISMCQVGYIGALRNNRLSQKKW